MALYRAMVSLACKSCDLKSCADTQAAMYSFWFVLKKPICSYWCASNSASYDSFKPSSVCNSNSALGFKNSEKSMVSVWVARLEASATACLSSSMPSALRAEIGTTRTPSFWANLSTWIWTPPRFVKSIMFRAIMVGSFKSATCENKRRFRFRLVASAINTTTSGCISFAVLPNTSNTKPSSLLFG